VLYAPSENFTEGNEQKKAELEKMVSNVRVDKLGGVLFPSEFDAEGNPLWKLELLSTGGSRSFDTVKILQMLHVLIALPLMSDFMLLGQQSGSAALGVGGADVKADMFTAALTGIVDHVCDVINTHAVPRLFALNGRKTDKLPKLAHGDVGSPQLDKLGKYLDSLVSAGANMDPVLENFLRSAAGWPERVEDDTTPNPSLAEQARADNPPPPPVPAPANSPAPVKPADAGGLQGGAD
jgi:hypothetical protein